MPAKLCLFACRNFHREVEATIAAEGWPDVVSAPFPARCGRPPIAWEELRGALPEGTTRVALLGRACLAGLGEPPAGFPPTRLLPQGECFHLIAGESLVAEAITGGGYLITPGWLADWRARLADMGFTPEAAGEFFKEFARELVLFDTNIDPESRARLDELTRTVGLPCKRIGVGLDHTRLLLARIVLEWRLEETRRDSQERDRRHGRELADHVTAMDLLARLAKTRDEAEAISAIEELFRMLFAPAAWHYLRVERGKPMPGSQVPDELLTLLRQMDTPYAWTPSGQGFLLRITWDNQVLGLIAADHLAYPEYRERYLNLALAMAGVCGLAIENARTHKQLVETEKMISLGIMVAGVAHEINTPVGVCLLAASALQEQTRRLAQRFGARSMTQAELQGYLDAAMTAGGLLRSNLERVGQLIDAFRQVAVEGRPMSKRRFRMRECLDEVIASLGERLDPGRVSLCVRCADDLEIVSYPSDWASIFTNLLSNSLQHGFKGREHGRIDIAIGLAAGQLALDYADNGVGLSEQARTRIFDPFFTTDMQHGMGLGMHLVYNLVTHRLGGGIACDGRPGEGVRFHIEIPL